MGHVSRPLSKTQKQRLIKIAEPFTQKNGILYQLGPDIKLCSCVIIKKKAQIIFQEFHEGVVRGHFATDIITKKIFHARYWWPTLFKD
jgi:hypothetical protein